MADAALIGVDWGTTSFRAYLIGADGRILDRRAAPAGILQVKDGDFGAVLEREVGAWRRAAPVPAVVASGMITSRQGWVETPYVACPAGIPDIAAGLVRHQGANGAIHFVPGLRTEGRDGIPDVIRGEETQIAGFADALGSGRVVLPGTHSKWADLEAGRIARFATHMTGEVFGVLRAHSILGRLMSGERHDPDAFARGVDAAGPAGAGLLRRLFSARTLGLFDRLPASALASYLSGLLIGSEIADATSGIGAPGPVLVVGEGALAARYLEALGRRGVAARPAPDDAAAAGHLVIARAAGLIA